MSFRRPAVCSLALTALTLAGCGAAPSPIGMPYTGMNTLHARAVSSTQLFVEPTAGAAPIVQAINSAKKSVLLELYMFTDNGAPAAIVQALCARAKAGVNVQVMLDPTPYTGLTPDGLIPNGMSPRFGAPTPNQNPNLPVAQMLQAAGCKVEDSAPRFTYTHEKSMVIDGQVALIMTCNFTNSAFSNNREYGVIDTNPQDVADVTNVFNADWARQAYTPQSPNLVVSPDNSRARLLALIDSAKTSIMLEDEEFQDPEVAAHLGARAKAGVNVRVEVSNGQGNAAVQQQLNAAGVTQVEFMSSLTLHAKTIVVDAQRAYVGSENMTQTSLDANREMGIILQDPTCVATLVKVTNQDWTSR